MAAVASSKQPFAIGGIAPGFGDDAGAVARADLGFIGLDQRVQRRGIDIALFDEERFQRLHPQRDRARVRCLRRDRGRDRHAPFVFSSSDASIASAWAGEKPLNGASLKGIRACVFDAYGTLFDVHGPVCEACRRNRSEGGRAVETVAAEAARIFLAPQPHGRPCRFLEGDRRCARLCARLSAGSTIRASRTS